jgi:hypothetical protein
VLRKYETSFTIGRMETWFYIYIYIPKHTWAEGIRGMMGEKGLKEEDWTDRSIWKRKIA